MRSSSTFGVHFILRMNKEKDGIAPVYVRINVNVDIPDQVDPSQRYQFVAIKIA